MAKRREMGYIEDEDGRKRRMTPSEINDKIKCRKEMINFLEQKIIRR